MSPTLIQTSTGLKQIDTNKIMESLIFASKGLERVDIFKVYQQTIASIHSGITTNEINILTTKSAAAFITEHYQYSYLAGGLILQSIYKEVFGESMYEYQDFYSHKYVESFEDYLNKGINFGILNPQLLDFDIKAIKNAIVPERDRKFKESGIGRVYKQYLLRTNNDELKVFELPQFWMMRVAMGLCLKEPVDKRTNQAIEYYNALSNFNILCATPTLLNAGKVRSQLSSCFLLTVQDDLKNIYKTYADISQLSKYAGGIGVDFTNIRATGSLINGTNGKSLGLIPFLKVMDASTAAVNQGGSRKGSTAVYLELWHKDFPDFLSCKYVSVDENRRCPNLNTAAWIPDLFMKRLIAGNDKWTLFSPSDVPELHGLYGAEFETKYEEYENNPNTPKETISLRKIWEEIITSLLGKGFGHPWITFKDPSNTCNPQKHIGPIYGSNLCCITADQRVVTDRGMLTIGELYKLGGQNKIVGLDGIYNASEMLLPRPNAPIVQINTKQGYTHKVTPDHKVWVKDIGWVEAQDLKEGDNLLIQQQEGIFGKQHNPDLAYIMGLVAGDGTFTDHSVCIDLWKEQFDKIQTIEQKVAKILAQSSSNYNTTSTPTPTFSISEKHNRARLISAPLGRILAEHNFTKNSKLSIPQLVWEGDKETIGSYLQGIYQADANINSGGEITTISFASINLQLIRDIQIIWANFGVKTSINKMRDAETRPMPDGKGGNSLYTSQPLYRLLITSIKGCQIAESIIKLTESRSSESVNKFKANIQKEGYTQKMYATFTNLTDLPNEDAYCLTVDSDNHAWTVNGMVTKNTEILLPTSEQETAVCNLSHLNLSSFLDSNTKEINWKELGRCTRLLIRVLNDVVDNNFYATEESEYSNKRHRAIGLGTFGLQTLMQKMGIPLETDQYVQLNDKLYEFIHYNALLESSDLAKDLGSYETFEGSSWSKGILHIDNYRNHLKSRGVPTSNDLDTQSLDWDLIRNKIKTDGLRNSQVMMIAPNRSTAYIVGSSPSTEPWDSNIFTEVGMSGKYTLINNELVDALDAIGLWTDSIIAKIKFYEGSIQQISEIPINIRNCFKTAYELHPKWLISANARRQKWVDMGISFNQWVNSTNGADVERMYIECWKAGLKTTYYLHSRSASQAERIGLNQSIPAQELQPTVTEQEFVCDNTNPDCEMCQ